MWATLRCGMSQVKRKKEGARALTLAVSRSDRRAGARPGSWPPAATTTTEVEQQPLRHDHDRRLEHGRPAHRGGGRAVPRGEPGREDHGRRSPAPAAASRSSAPARPTSPTPRARSSRKRSTACKKEGIAYEEVQVANDGIAVVVNPENDWAECLTTAELKKIWDKGSNVNNWNQVKSGLPGRGDEAVRRRAPTRARSTTSPSRSTVRRDAAAPTTARPRTTTSRSRACPAARATSATSASPTRSRTRTR